MQQENYNIDPKFLWDNLNKYIDTYISINYNKFYPLKEDIKNDLFIKIYSKNSYNPNKAKISTFLTNVCKNHIIDMKRSYIKTKQREEDYSKENLEFNTPSNLEYVDTKEISNVFAEFKNELTKVEHYIVDYKFIMCKKDKEIYEYLRIPREKYKRYYNKIMSSLLEKSKNSPYILEYLNNFNIKH